MIRPLSPVFRQAGWPAGRAEAGLRICRTLGTSADTLAGSWPAAPGCRSQPPAGPAGPGRSIEPGSMSGAILAVVRPTAAGAAVMVAAGAGLRGVIAVLCGCFGNGDRAFWGIRGGGQRWQRWQVAVLPAAVDCAFVAAVQGVYLRARANGCGLQT